MTRGQLLAAFIGVAPAFFVGHGDVQAVDSAKRTTLTAAAENETDATNKSVTKSRADDVLAQLLAGNERFVKGELHNPRRTPNDFRAVAIAQYPVAVIVACAELRVAPELLFDMLSGTD